MEFAKQRYIVKPGAIHVAQQFDLKVTTKQSPFSDGYDMARAALALGGKVNQKLTEDDEQFQQWEEFKAHELLLKQHLQKETGRKHHLVWGEYEILSSENDRFKNIGSLTSSGDDGFFMHTKQGIRMWEGNNNKKNGPRWPGIRYGLTLSNELFGMAMSDNPYAQSRLLQIEKQMSEIEEFFDTVKKQVQAQIDSLAAAGMKITLIQNNNPVHIRLNALRAYGFKLVKLLRDYDSFVCAVKTLNIKGMMANKQCNDTLYNGGRMMRKLLNDLYIAVMETRAIKNIRRDSLLDPEQLAKLKSAVDQEILPRIPLSVWVYESQPSLVYIQKKMNQEDLNKLVDIVRDNGLSG